MDNVRHDPQSQRFAVTVDGVEAFLDYERDGRVIVITHTVVPPAIGGRGIAAELVRGAFAYARDTGGKVRPACSYAAAYARKHPEIARLLV